jgi:quercetin dioxygenase-like cupin family protein
MEFSNTRFGPGHAAGRNRRRALPAIRNANAKEKDAMKIMDYRDAPARELTAAAMHGVTGRVVLGKADGADHFCMRVIEVAPGGVIPPHRHPWEHEQFVHAGRGRILRDGQWTPFGPGTVLFIPSDVEHTIENIGDDPLVIICLVPNFAPEL